MYQGSCHCGAIRYEIDGTIDQVIECNCSHCSRKGYLLWFVPGEALRMKSGADDIATYTFNKHVIHHQFCEKCGCAPFGKGTNPQGGATVAVNVRCLENVDFKSLKTVQVDGRSM